MVGSLDAPLLIVCRFKSIKPLNSKYVQTEILKRFGRKVRKLRLSRGWSQEKLAERADLHRTYIGGVERGERNISLHNIGKIAKAFGISPSRLLET